MNRKAVASAGEFVLGFYTIAEYFWIATIDRVHPPVTARDPFEEDSYFGF